MSKKLWITTYWLLYLNINNKILIKFVLIIIINYKYKTNFKFKIEVYKKFKRI